jgi:hypothetical protein
MGISCSVILGGQEAERRFEDKIHSSLQRHLPCFLFSPARTHLLKFPEIPKIASPPVDQLFNR